MPLGGSAFNNELIWIYESIIKAVTLLELKHTNYKDKLEIHFLTYDRSRTHEFAKFTLLEQFKNISTGEGSNNISIKNAEGFDKVKYFKDNTDWADSGGKLTDITEAIIQDKTIWKQRDGINETWFIYVLINVKGSDGWIAYRHTRPKKD
jgi:hypothetical protein